MTRENASARPPRIIVFTVLPSMYKMTNVASAEMGMESRTAKVARRKRSDQIDLAGMEYGKDEWEKDANENQ